MTSKNYFRIAGVFVWVFIFTYFVELVGLLIWINRIAGLVFPIFAILVYFQKKKEDNIKSDTNTE